MTNLPVIAETLQSETFEIKDVTVNSAGQVMTSDSFLMLNAIGNPLADARLVSGSYELKSDFPNGTLANVPVIGCFETTTDNTNSTCLNLPNDWGAKGECGYGGCFDRAKLEIDHQENPYDTLYLIRIIDTTDNTAYFLQSDHTLGLTFDISNFMTICALEGRNPNDPDCDDLTDPNWNAALQSYNILGLDSNTQYEVSAAALNGDFTGTRFSTSVLAETGIPSLFFDLDTGAESDPGVNNDTPYDISLGEITYFFPVTATNLIWMDMGINTATGLNIFVRDLNSGIRSIANDYTIPSESEDLATDSNNNGGFGLKTYNYSPSELSLGPVKRSSVFDTSTSNSVGALSTSNSLLFSTDTTGGTKGQLLEGRGAVYVKARATATSPASDDYQDTLTFIIVGNF